MNTATCTETSVPVIIELILLHGETRYVIPDEDAIQTLTTIGAASPCLRVTLGVARGYDMSPTECTDTSQ
jgi:hypothetical protein